MTDFRSNIDVVQASKDLAERVGTIGEDGGRRSPKKACGQSPLITGKGFAESMSISSGAILSDNSRSLLATSEDVQFAITESLPIPEANTTATIEVGNVCRKHLQSLCKYSKECRNVHLCRERFGFLLGNDRGVLDRLRSPATSPPTTSMPGSSRQSPLPPAGQLPMPGMPFAMSSMPQMMGAQQQPMMMMGAQQQPMMMMYPSAGAPMGMMNQMPPMMMNQVPGMMPQMMPMQQPMMMPGNGMAFMQGMPHYVIQPPQAFVTTCPQATMAVPWNL